VGPAGIDFTNTPFRPKSFLTNFLHQIWTKSNPTKTQHT
jgi:hypothetical protein